MIRYSLSAAVLSVLSLLLVVAVPAIAAEGVSLQIGEPPPENPASVTRDASLSPRFSDRPRDAFLLPLFEVDRSSPFAETTLIAVRNVTDQSHDVRITYWVDHVFDPMAEPDLVQDFSLAGKQIRTISLRDLPEITGGADGDAIVQGWLMVEHVDAVGDVLSTDWFRVDDDQDFAVGDRMVDVDTSYTCLKWELRYIVGAGFDGGTRLEVFTDTPLGLGTVTFFDEAGINQGTVNVGTNRQAVQIDVAELLAELPGSPAASGGMEVLFQPGTNGGLVMSTYSAAGQYSVGMDAVCLNV